MGHGQFLGEETSEADAAQKREGKDLCGSDIEIFVVRRDPLGKIKDIE